MAEHTVTLYTRDNCHLCDEAEATVERVAADLDASVSVEFVDVDADPGLREEYGEKVPYVFVDDRPAFKFRVDEPALRSRLRS